MKQIVLLSGKGGTGKTTVAAAFAHLAAQESRIVLIDADVDAANLELLLGAKKVEYHDFIGGKEASIDDVLCIACGRCAEVCRFDAVIETEDSYRIDPIACEGCAACYYQCPSEAIAMKERHAGLWFRSETHFGPLFHARLYAGQENSGKLVTMVRQQANLWGVDHEADYILIDGPPGIGCPVIAACAGADLAILIVEPTIAGVHDLERILATTEHFRVPAALVINKWDLDAERVAEIEHFAEERDIPIAGRVPFDTVVTEAIVQGRPVTAYDEAKVRASLEQAWHVVRALLR